MSFPVRPHRAAAVLMPLVLLASALTAASASRAAPATPDSVLTLPALERAVLDRNPSLEAMRAAAREAAARARVMGALEDPMLDVMAAPGSIGSDAVDPAWSVAVSQKLPLFGERGLERRAARFEARAASEDVAAMRLDLVADARSLYYEYYEIDRSLEALREQVDLLERFRKAALARYAAGLVEQQDPLQAESEQAMLDHERVVLERRRRIVTARLDALMHEPADRPLPPPPAELPEPPPVERILQGAADRPEVRAATARIEARRASLALAGRAGVPQPAIGLVYDRYMAEPQWRTSITLSMNLPLWRGRVGAQRDEARAALAMAEAAQRVVADSVDLEVQEAAAAVHESAHEVGILRDKVLPLARRSLEASRAGYEAGRGDFLAVVNAARDVVRARLQLIVAMGEWQRAAAMLERAIGAPIRTVEDEEGTR